MENGWSSALLMNLNVGLSAASGNQGSYKPGAANEEMTAYVEQVFEKMLGAVAQAKASLKPTEMGFGEGKLYLNVNRDGIDPKSREWMQVQNLDFPSDKTLAVIVFRQAGEVAFS